MAGGEENIYIISNRSLNNRKAKTITHCTVGLSSKGKNHMRNHNVYNHENM